MGGLIVLLQMPTGVSPFNPLEHGTGAVHAGKYMKGKTCE